MSSHPNTLLMLQLSPNEPSIDVKHLLDAECDSEGDCTIKLGGFDYSVATDDENDMQIRVPEGSAVLHDFLTYGYTDVVNWNEVPAIVDALKTWAEAFCDKHNCSYHIYIGANFW